MCVRDATKCFLITCCRDLPASQPRCLARRARREMTALEMMGGRQCIAADPEIEGQQHGRGRAKREQAEQRAHFSKNYATGTACALQLVAVLDEAVQPSALQHVAQQTEGGVDGRLVQRIVGEEAGAELRQHPVVVPERRRHVPAAHSRHATQTNATNPKQRFTWGARGNSITVVPGAANSMLERPAPCGP